MIRNRSIPSRPIRRVRGRGHCGRHVVVLGAGGNIGSHLVPLLARLPGVARLTLVDDDRYEARNLGAQDIQPSDVGQPKAQVQARRAQRINPQLKVVAIAERLENVPLGRLRGDLIAACLDSRKSRRATNEIAWRLGVTWIDAGVEPSGWLARVNVYQPAPDQPCLECGWDDRDYAELATRHPCQPESVKAPPTGAPACLGSLAAACQAIECQKLLAGQFTTALIGRELLIEAVTHQHFVTALRRNPNCRFDHGTWKMDRLQFGPGDLSLHRALLLVPGNGSNTLSFGGQALVEQLACPVCGFMRKVFRLTGRLRAADRRCDRCEGPLLLPSGFAMQTHVSTGSIGTRAAARSLASIGLRAGDIFTVSDGCRERHYEIRGPGGKP